MERCNKGCTICIGLYCDYHKTKCDKCGKKFKTADLWTVNGKNYCNECYGGMEGWGNQASAREEAEKLN